MLICVGTGIGFESGCFLGGWFHVRWAIDFLLVLYFHCRVAGGGCGGDECWKDEGAIGFVLQMGGLEGRLMVVEVEGAGKDGENS